MAGSPDITENMDRLFNQVKDDLSSYYSREDFERVLAQLDRAPKTAQKFRMNDLERLFKARGLDKQGIDAQKLVEDRTLLKDIPDRNEIKTELLNAFYNMYLQFPRNTDFMERLVRRLAPEYTQDPVRVVILKKFLLGSSPSFKRYRTAMPLEWAQEHLTPADQRELHSLPEEKKRAFLTDRITDALFVQHLSTVDAKKLSPAETLRFIVRRVTNYQTRLAPLTEPIDLLEKLLNPEELSYFDTLSRAERLELLQDRLENDFKKSTAAHLDTGILPGLILLLEGLHANGLHQLSLEELELSPGTLQRIDDFLAPQCVKAESSALDRVLQCAETAERIDSLNAETAQQLLQLVNSIETDLHQQLTAIPRITRTGALGNMDTIYVQDKKDAESAKTADSELLSLCNDLAAANFRGNGRTRVALYHFALMFGMTFSLDNSCDRNRDVESNLFHDFYSNDLLRALDPSFSRSKTIEREPTGEGINYKSFVECIYLYYLNHTELERTPGERIDAAERLIAACVRKATALEKEKERPFQLPSAAEERTLIYKQELFRELLEKTPKQLPTFIAKNYLVLSPETTGQYRIMIASGENTAQDLAEEYLTEQDHERFSFFDGSSESLDQDTSSCITEDLSFNSTPFHWNLRSQLENTFGADKNFLRVVAALDDRVRSKTGRYNINMRHLMVELLHVLAHETPPDQILLQREIEKHFSPAVKQILKFEQQKNSNDNEDAADTGVEAVTMLNAWKRLVEIGYDIPRLKVLRCSLSEKSGEKTKEQEAEIQKLSCQLEKIGYTVRLIQTSRGNELQGFSPYKKNAAGSRENEDALLAQLSCPVQKTSAFYLGGREYQDPQLTYFLQKVSKQYIANADALATSLSGILSRRLMKRITRSELIILHFNYYIATIDPEPMDTFAKVYEDYAGKINPLLEQARFQPLSSKIILDMYLVCELYLYLLDTTQYLSPYL